VRFPICLSGITLAEDDKNADNSVQKWLAEAAQVGDRNFLVAAA
jgi:hypothetical protein